MFSESFNVICSYGDFENIKWLKRQQESVTNFMSLGHYEVTFWNVREIYKHLRQIPGESPKAIIDAYVNKNCSTCIIDYRTHSVNIHMHNTWIKKNKFIKIISWKIGCPLSGIYVISLLYYINKFHCIFS